MTAVATTSLLYAAVGVFYYSPPPWRRIVLTRKAARPDIHPHKIESYIKDYFEAK